MEPSMKRMKRLWSYNKNWENDYEWLKATNNPQEAKCIICQSVFKIGYMGVVAITQHKNSDGHKNKIRVSSSNSLIDRFYKSKF